jgi:POT family proton-dependent oligopeptide transporter
MNLDVLLIIIGAIFSAVMIGVAYVINHKEQPKQIWMLFFTEMWERFSFYGMRALLILYMTHVLFFPDKDANLQYGAYNALVYTMPLLGGWLADRLLGFRKSIVLGGILMAIGHLVLAIPSQATFFLGLGFLISGNGFFKPNISSLLGRYYTEQDPRKDAGYSIFYMGVNIGAFLGGAICGYLGQKVSWHLGFGIAGAFMILGLIVFLVFQRILDDQGYPPVPEALEKKVGGVLKMEWALYLGAFLLVPLMVFLVQCDRIMSPTMESLCNAGHTGTLQYLLTVLRDLGVMGALLYLFGIAAVIYVIVESFKFDKASRQKLWAAMIMIIFTVLFWGFYEQSGGSLNLMSERNVDMHVFGHELPSAMVNNAVNPFYIIFLTPLFAVMWSFLERKKIDPSTPMKFGLAFLFLGGGYYLFYLGGMVGKDTGYMPMIYFLGAYLVITTGELFLSPIGLSMITKLSPKQMVGFMMGMWFLASAFGQHLAGEIGARMSVPHAANGEVVAAVISLPIYMKGCNQIALVSLGGGAALILLSPVIRKLMNGVH